MPIGTITKLIHLSGQASRLQNAALVPTRNTIGYGLLEGEDGEQLYFDPDAFDGPFEDVRLGQSVQYERDKQYAIATSVRPTDELKKTLSPERGPNGQTSQIAAEVPSAPAVKKPPAAAAPQTKKAEEPTLVLSSPRQCIFVARYVKVAPGQWRRVGTLPEIETYRSEVANEYREPVITEISSSRAIARVYDEQAVNLRRVTDFLGNYRAAQERCDRALLAHFAGDQLADSEALPRW